jgi:hypothetical protein
VSEPIGPGDWVECVKASPRHSHLIGRIFQVTIVGPVVECFCGCGECAGIMCEGLPEPPPGALYCISCFRLIGRKGAFDHLLEVEVGKKVAADLRICLPADYV